MSERPRPITWLASYQRSGNTYLRALIANFLHDQDAPVPLNQLREYVTGEHQPDIWSEVTGKTLGELELDEAWPARSRYFDALRALPGQRAVLVKTHTINGAYKDIPAFDFHPGDRIIHIVRHPGDVAVSQADFHGHEIERSINRLVMPGLIVDGRPRTGIEVVGSWAQFTRMWLNERRIPLLTVRYPELVASPGKVLNVLAPFIGFPPDPHRIARAVDFTRFDNLQAQEASEGFAEASHKATSGRFFRAGRSGQWREALTPEQIETLVIPNQGLIDELGLSADA